MSICSKHASNSKFGAQRKMLRENKLERADETLLTVETKEGKRRPRATSGQSFRRCRKKSGNCLKKQSTCMEACCALSPYKSSDSKLPDS